MAEENTNNPNDPKSILMLPGLVVVVAFLLALFMLTSIIVPGLQEYVSLSNSYKTQKAQYDNVTQELETFKQTQAAALQAASNTEGIDKDFFRPLESGVDSESLLAGEFNHILELMAANQIKTRSVKYTYDPADDNFVKSASSKFNVCQLDMQMIANYSNFKNFMKHLYKHEHYLDIANLEIVPYNKNKTILLVKLRLKLYAEKV